MSFSVFCVTVRIISLLLATSGKSVSKSKNKNINPKKKAISFTKRNLIHKHNFLGKMKIQLNYCATKAVLQVCNNAEKSKMNVVLLDELK